jgi:hypothetical protein
VTITSAQLLDPTPEQYAALLHDICLQTMPSEDFLFGDM